jgi:parallel beta-helix repeat protein
MDKKCGILIICTAILFLVFIGEASAKTWYVNSSGGADFTSIQKAVNYAGLRDTIIVNSGTYNENVDVYKQLILRGVDTGGGKPVVDACGSGSAITLSADGITLVGFTATNSGDWDDGIRVTSNNNSISGNNVSNNNGDGFALHSSCNNSISGNTFVNDGLVIFNSYQNTVEDNTVNGKPLVYLKDTSDIEVTDAGQVILVNCSNISVENLDLSNTSIGIGLWATEDSVISNNDASNNDYGISLLSSSNNSISGNNVSNINDCGISLHSSSNNSISGNNVSNNNGDGIFLGSSSNNLHFWQQCQQQRRLRHLLPLFLQ